MKINVRTIFSSLDVMSCTMAFKMFYTGIDPGADPFWSWVASEPRPRYKVPEVTSYSLTPDFYGWFICSNSTCLSKPYLYSSMFTWSMNSLLFCDMLLLCFFLRGLSDVLLSLSTAFPSLWPDFYTPDTCECCEQMICCQIQTEQSYTGNRWSTAKEYIRLP